MKRSRLQRKAPLRRAKDGWQPPKQGSGLKRSARRRVERERMDPALARPVFVRQAGLCICGCGRMIAPFPLGYHHVFPKGLWPELVNDIENWVGVAADCHANHESRAARLPRRVCRAAETAIPLDGKKINYLNRTYGSESD